MKLIIKTTGTTPEQFEKIIEEQIKSTQDSLLKLGQDTRDYMRQVIVGNTNRPESTGDLIRTIEAHPLPDGVGVGKVADLPVYWAAVNFGSNHMVGKHLPLGSFAPGVPKPDLADFRGGRWQKSYSPGGNLYSPLVTKPIPAMDYIQKTGNWANTEIKIRFRKVK